MKVSRKIIRYTQTDLDRLLLEIEGVPKGSKEFMVLADKIQTVNRHLEKDYEKRLSNLWKSINAAIAQYREEEGSPAPLRTESFMRLLKSGDTLVRFGNTDAPKERYVELAALLLKELDVTEKDHNTGAFSFRTKSTLAKKYMQVFQENGIDPEDSMLKEYKDASEQQKKVYCARMFSTIKSASSDVNPAADAKGMLAHASNAK